MPSDKQTEMSRSPQDPTLTLLPTVEFAYWSGTKNDPLQGYLCNKNLRAKIWKMQ